MPTQDNNSSITYFESALLAEDVYKKNAKDRGVNGWRIDDQIKSNFDSGLQIQNYQNATHPNHTVIAIAGTNGLNDWDDNLSFITGGLSEQFQQALTYVAKTIDAAAQDSDGFSQNQTFSVTGHSLGGGIAQIIAYTFGLNGVALDAPGADAIIANNEYQAHIASLQTKYPNAFNNVGDTPSTGENFTNIVEKGSLVSSIGTHIGTKIEIDAVSDAKTVIGVAFMRANLPIGLAMIVDGLVDNHKIQFMISYFKNNPNLNKWQLTNKQLEKLEYELGPLSVNQKMTIQLIPLPLTLALKPLTHGKTTTSLNLTTKVSGLLTLQPLPLMT
ncbi:hypothetical protein [uncultured Gammaproteobacteria bacterium]|nr:hypothetical protein [uncultured Gammaproteobacteria bacterium]